MNKRKQRQLRHHRVRARVYGNKHKPRLSVFRSAKHIYAQLIDDERGVTLVSASSQAIKKTGKKSELASEVGKLLASKALEQGVMKAVFDRGGFRYHGRVKSLAEAARAAGLKF